MALLNFRYHSRYPFFWGYPSWGGVGFYLFTIFFPLLMMTPFGDEG